MKFSKVAEYFEVMEILRLRTAGKLFMDPGFVRKVHGAFFSGCCNVELLSAPEASEFFKEAMSNAARPLKGRATGGEQK